MKLHGFTCDVCDRYSETVRATITEDDTVTVRCRHCGRLERFSKAEG